jgi:hypothetical protein
METPEKFATEAESIFRKWLDKTIEALEYERIKLKVQDSKDLKDSLRSTVMQVAPTGARALRLTRAPDGDRLQME